MRVGRGDGGLGRHPSWCRCGLGADGGADGSAGARAGGRVVGGDAGVDGRGARGAGGTEVVEPVGLERQEGDGQVGGVTDRGAHGAPREPVGIRGVGEHVFAKLGERSDGTRVRINGGGVIQCPCRFC